MIKKTEERFRKLEFCVRRLESMTIYVPIHGRKVEEYSPYHSFYWSPSHLQPLLLSDFLAYLVEFLGIEYQEIPGSKQFIAKENSK